MLDAATLPLLRAGKNLLAFSAGIDSTALFFLLLREKIPFDIAHVNYHTRAQSSDEADYARTLAERYGKRCFVHDAAPIGSNFEAEARRVRYTFFESLIAEHGYDTLLTAHQLDDRLEWLFMQLCKGAGLPELLGMEATAKRGSYTLVRPLLGAGKPELRAPIRRSVFGVTGSETRFPKRCSPPAVRESKNHSSTSHAMPRCCFPRNVPQSIRSCSLFKHPRNVLP